MTVFVTSDDDELWWICEGTVAKHSKIKGPFGSLEKAWKYADTLYPDPVDSTHERIKKAFYDR